MTKLEKIEKKAIELGFKLTKIEGEEAIYYKREYSNGFDGLRIAVNTKYDRFSKAKKKYSFTLSTYANIRENVLNRGMLKGDKLSSLEGYFTMMERGTNVKHICDLAMIAEDMSNIEGWIKEMKLLASKIESTQLSIMYLEGKVTKDERNMLKKEIQSRFTEEFESELTKRYNSMTVIKALSKKAKEI